MVVNLPKRIEKPPLERAQCTHPYPEFQRAIFAEMAVALALVGASAAPPGDLSRSQLLSRPIKLCKLLPYDRLDQTLVASALAAPTCDKVCLAVWQKLD
jgi:hypothetical protein